MSSPAAPDLLQQRLLDHTESVQFSALPTHVVQAALGFIADTAAVGLAGGRHPRLAQVRAAAAAWGDGQDAREWHGGRRCSAPTAAMLNAYRIHNQEFDCVHERAVVHPLATLLPALVAQAERRSRAGQPVSGAALIEALVVAVDVAITIGEAQVAPMRFFRPAMCGALGATLGLAKLGAQDRSTMANAFGIVYSQLAGTMQAHAEGSPMLALQVGLASRAAIVSHDLAVAGFSGPTQVMTGTFGYFDLFDAPLASRRDRVDAVFSELGRRWRVAELSHKPFPTGRAAHGAIDGLANLVRVHQLVADQIAHIELAAPPLILRLVDRPARPDMDVNYARLCLPYLVATWLLRGQVTLDDFDDAARGDPQRIALAGRVHCVPNDYTDPNALAPQSLRLMLTDGRVLQIELPEVLGHPDRPLDAAAQRAKFDHCCAHAGFDRVATQALHQACMDLTGLTDVTTWVDSLCPNP